MGNMHNYVMCICSIGGEEQSTGKVVRVRGLPFDAFEYVFLCLFLKAAAADFDGV
jgi:hypothetical protein